MKSTPLPRWLVLGNSVIVIAISAVFAGWSIGVFALYINTNKVILSVVLLPFSLAIIVLQYAAGFRRKLSTVEAVLAMHCIGCLCCGFCCFFVVLFFLNSENLNILNSEKSFASCLNAVLTSGLWFYSCFCVWVNDRERHYLQKAKDAEEFSTTKDDVKPFQFTLRELLGAIVVLSMIASVARYTVHDANKNFREHVAREEVPASHLQLPEGAHDVCYGMNNNEILACEFNIDEAGFFRWAESLLDQWPAGSVASIEKIPKNGHEMIGSYLSLRYNMPFGDHRKYALIRHGYYCNNIVDDKGFRLAYDTKNARAYYYGQIFSQQP